ncbi:hypothetical protein ACFL7M_17430 [Thermodesulfobacteriota bacterium]
MIPGWVGLFFLMGRRTMDEQYVDVTPEGITITSPAERLFVPVEEIVKIRYSRLRRRLMIHAGRRRIKIRGVMEARKTPKKEPLWRWLASPTPHRLKLRTGITSLRNAIEELIAK